MSKKEESTELASWQQALVADATKVAHNEGSDSMAVKIQHGHLMYRDQPIPNDELSVVVIASSTERCYYDQAYDADVITSPACFAQSLDSHNLTPHPNVASPQHETCTGCPMAEFGSAKQGKGPACKTYRKLVFMPADTQAENVATADLAYLKVSPTSVKNWQFYCQQLVASAGIPPWAATTQIKVVPDKKTMWQVLFSAIAPLQDDALLSAIHGRIEAAEEIIMQPYTYDEDEGTNESKNY